MHGDLLAVLGNDFVLVKVGVDYPVRRVASVAQVLQGLVLMIFWLTLRAKYFVSLAQSHVQLFFIDPSQRLHCAVLCRLPVHPHFGILLFEDEVHDGLRFGYCWFLIARLILGRIAPVPLTIDEVNRPTRLVHLSSRPSSFVFSKINFSCHSGFWGFGVLGFWGAL